MLAYHLGEKGVGMKYSFSQVLRTKMQEIPTKKEIHYFKMVCYVSFMIGFLVFLCLGKEFVKETTLLDTEALKAIRDNTIESGAFLQYISAKRMLLFVIEAVLWWWGISKIYLYGVWICYSMSAGACLFISLLRYPFSGLFLWIFLYIPHGICYALTLLCAILLAAGKIKGREEKILYLWNHRWLLVSAISFYLLGIYCESYIHIKLLQHFLKYF